MEWLIVLLVLAAAGAIAYFTFFRNKDKPSKGSRGVGRRDKDEPRKDFQEK